MNNYVEVMMQCPKCGSASLMASGSMLQCRDCQEVFPNNAGVPNPFPNITPPVKPVQQQPVFVPNPFERPEVCEPSGKTTIPNQTPVVPPKPPWDKNRDIKWQVAVKCATELCIAEGITSVSQVKTKAIQLLSILVEEPDTCPIPKEDPPKNTGNPNLNPAINPQPPIQNYTDPTPILTPGQPEDNRGFKEKQEGIEMINNLTSICDTHANWDEAEKKLHNSKPHPSDVIYFEQLHNMWIDGQVKAFDSALR